MVAIIFFIRFYWSQKLVRLNYHKYQDQFAVDNPFLTLRWINWIVILLIVIPFITTSLHITFKTLHPELDVIIVMFGLLLTICIFSYFAFRQPTLYEEEQKELIEQAENKTALSSPTFKKTEASPTFTVSDAEKEAYIQKIETYFEETKPYLVSKIRMPDLARSLNIPRHIFSFIINEHYQMNFFNLINKYRIEYAKKLLSDEDNHFYTLKTISEMAGFNSRSTFNKSFKALEGISPKVYQNNLK
jgi:AraC-like DNA-binding protein